MLPEIESHFQFLSRKDVERQVVLDYDLLFPLKLTVHNAAVRDIVFEHGLLSGCRQASVLPVDMQLRTRLEKCLP